MCELTDILETEPSYIAIPLTKKLLNDLTVARVSRSSKSRVDGLGHNETRCFPDLVSSQSDFRPENLKIQAQPGSASTCTQFISLA
jgi:hypothetical protein